jgi:hypothetical protein
MNVAETSAAQRESSGRGAPRLGGRLSASQPALRADLSRQQMRFVAPKT